MRATVYSAAWLLPVTRTPIRDGSVLVDERGIIRAVGARADVHAGDDVARVELGECVLLPGLINVHAHPELAAMRGLLEDLPFHEWIPTLRRVKDRANLEAADYDAAARWTCLEAIAAGITTLGATEDSGAALHALRETGMRGIVYREVFGPAPPTAGAALQALREKVDAMRAAASDLVHIGVSPHAPYTVSDELFRLVAAYAATESLPVAVHAAESEAEALLVSRGDGPFAAGLRTRGIATPPRARSTFALLDRTGILATQPLLIHCVRVDEQDIARLADTGARVAHCAVANGRLGHGIAPVIELLEAGVAIGLGTDSVAANNRIDILEEARVAQLAQRMRLGSAGALPPERLLRLATLDSARVLGLDHRVGSLEPGKDADLCAIRLAALHIVPVHDPVAALFFSARASDVVLTVVRGNVLYRDGAHLTLVDAGALRARIEHMAARLRAARERR